MARRTSPESLKLPDQLLVRYFREGEIDVIESVEAGKAGGITVKLHGGKRTDRWRDLGGGLGFVPDEE